MFPSGNFPIAELQPHGVSSHLTSSSPFTPSQQANAAYYTQVASPGATTPYTRLDTHNASLDRDNSPRVSLAEERERDRLMQVDMLPKLRQAAEVQRYFYYRYYYCCCRYYYNTILTYCSQVRSFAQEIIRPGIVLADMCERLENMNRALVGENGLQVSTIAYSTTIYINLFNVIAGWHCLPNRLLH